MRCLVVTDTFPCTSETFVSAQVAGLAGLGHDVRVLSERRPRSAEPVHPEVLAAGLLDRTTYADLPVEADAGLSAWPPWELTWPPGSATPVRNARRWLSAGPAAARLAVRAPRSLSAVLLRGGDQVARRSLATLHRASALAQHVGAVDVVHAHFGPVASNYTCAVPVLGAPLVVTFHGYDFSQWPAQRGADVYRQLFRSVAAVTVNSDHARRRVEALGCPATLLHRLNVGIDLAAHPYRPRSVRPGEAVRLVTVARLSAKKGHEVALEAVARLRQATGLALRYDIVGDGPDRARVEERVRELGLSEVVVLHGALPSDGVARLLDEAHLFLLASRTAPSGDEEGTPVVLMEAQARGLPVVSTLHSGIPEIVQHGRTGRLAREGDAAGLAHELRLLVDAPHTWAETGAAGRAHVAQHHDAGRLLHALVDIYRAVGAGRGRPRPGERAAAATRGTR